MSAARAVLLAAILALPVPGRGGDWEPALPDAQTLFAPLAACSELHYDWSGQFTGPPRNQGAMGTCHIFASVGILEAAWRRMGREAVRFSEADLFVQRMVLGGEVLGGMDSRLQEGGMIDWDLQYAFDHGVAQGDGYQAFLGRWRRYVNDVGDSVLPFALHAAVQRTFAAMLGRPDPEVDPVQLLRDSRTTPRARLEIRRLFQDDARLAANRAQSWSVLGTMRAESVNFPFQYPADYPRSVIEASAADCLHQGRDQERAIVAELRAGRPVAVGMYIDGLPAWGAGVEDAPDLLLDRRGLLVPGRGGAGVPGSLSPYGNHIFIITGMDGAPGNAVYHVRNSWGASAEYNPDVRSDQLCRVYQVLTVLNEGEEGALPRLFEDKVYTTRGRQCPGAVAD